MAAESHVKGSTDVELIEQTIWNRFVNICKSEGLREAFVCPQENMQFTFIQLRQESEKLAAGLYASGLRAEDRVALWAANYANALVTVYACCRLGAVFSCLNPNLDETQLLKHLAQGDFKAFVCFPTAKSGSSYRTLAKICPELAHSAKGKMSSRTLPKLSHVIMAEEDHKLGGTYTLSEIFGFGKPDALEKLAKVEPNSDPHSVATIQFTTGTTGDPKPTLLSHYQLLNSCLVAGKRLGFDKPGEIFCCPMPLFRGPVLCLSVIATAAFGIKLVYPSPTPTPPLIFKAIQEQKCTSILSNPIAFHLMMRLATSKNFDISTLTTACLIGEKLPTEVIASINKSTSVTDVVVGLFHTEAGCMPIMFPAGGKADKLSKSAGTVAPHYEVKIVTNDGSTAARGTLGEIYFKPIAGKEFLGYYKEPELSKGYFLDGWLRTGYTCKLNQPPGGQWVTYFSDVGIMDAEGYITILGQHQELIDDGADKPPVEPWPIEKCLSSHPLIIGAQVVGVPLSSDLCACVVVKDKGEPMSKEGEKDLKNDLLALCKEHKVNEPSYVVFVKDFPRTPTRKVQKFKLKEMVLDLIKEQCVLGTM